MILIFSLPLKCKYPRLFSLSNKKEVNVGDLRVNNTMEGNWVFFGGDVFVWESIILVDLLDDLV